MRLIEIVTWGGWGGKGGGGVRREAPSARRGVKRGAKRIGAHLAVEQSNLESRPTRGALTLRLLQSLLVLPMCREH